MSRGNKNEPMAKLNTLILGTICLFLLVGTVFTFGMQFWNAPIAEDEAIHETLSFSSYQIQYNRTSPKQIIIRWEAYRQLEIDGVSITQELIDYIRSLNRGDELSVIFHPNSGVILEMHHGDRMLLGFDDTMHKLRREATGFLVMGIFMYGVCIAGVWELIRREK